MKRHIQTIVLIIGLLVLTGCDVNTKNIEPTTHTITIEYVVLDRSNQFETIDDSALIEDVLNSSTLSENNLEVKNILGYDFIGLYEDEMTIFESKTLTEDTTIYVVYEPKEVVVNFDFQGGESPEPTRAIFHYGEKLRTNTNLTLEEHVFLGFFMDTAVGEIQLSDEDGVFETYEILDHETFPEVFNDNETSYELNIYAKYEKKQYKVELKYGYNSEQNQSINVVSGEDIASYIPQDVADIIDRDNNIYVRFVGWSLLEERMLPIENTIVTNSVILHALWQPLVYYERDGEEIKREALPFNGIRTYTLDEASTLIGHTFLYWRAHTGITHFLNDQISIPETGLQLEEIFSQNDYSNNDWDLHLTYNRDDEYLVSDSPKDVIIDSINFIELYNLNFQYLYDLGFKELFITISFEAKEVDTGKQEIDIFSLSDSTNELLVSYDEDLGGFFGLFLQSSYVTLEYILTLNLEDYLDSYGFNIIFIANGSGDDDWINKNLEIIITSSLEN